MHPDSQRVIADLQELKALTSDERGAQRVAWGPVWRTTRAWFAEKVQRELGLPCERDGAGNLWATLPGARTDSLVIGSHLDSVPGGGWLDGVLGVLGGLEVLRRVKARGTPPVTIRLVDWADEEGARFGRSLAGSAASAGTLDAHKELAHLTDRDGVKLPAALLENDVTLDGMATAPAYFQALHAKAYLELHIEQGPVLEAMKKPTAVVLGTMGVERHTLKFVGQAAHSGAAPIHLRKDAFLAAAEFAIACREISVQHSGRTPRTRVVATCGVVKVEPNFVTAVPGSTEISIDLRKRPNCTSLLAHGLIGNGDPECTLRTLALAVLTGWFRGLLGSSDCSDDKMSKAAPMEQTLAWLIAWLAWRVIWGIDITKQGAAGIEKCLKLLFEEWCCGFHYKGPHCGCDAHGIILGCVEISPKGKILCFDEWAHRRYVLTGPLITHWTGQFGLAPVDVMATRLAGWICCVAKAPMPSKPDFDFANAASAYLPLGNAGLGLGQGFGSAPAFHGVPVMPQANVIGPLDFVAQILREIGRGAGPRLATATSIRRITMQGSDLSLLEPVEAPQLVDRSASRLVQAIRREVDAAPPMIRTPMADFVQAIAAEVAVADLQPAVDNPLVAPLAKVLETTGIGTAGDLIEAGPEPALARARPGLALDPAFADRSATDKAMALLYGAAQSVVSKAAAAVADAANNRPADDPFVRADLVDPATLTAVRRATAAHIQGRGLLASTLRDIATKVVDARP